MRKKLSTAPYKGTKDTYPEDMYYRNYLFNIWRDVAKTFGYQEYDTPFLEKAALYREKSGDEIAKKQLYCFEDKGGREIAIRPEMTPSLARIVAAKRKELRFPLRWFNIGRYYRYEKPQRGRTREFFQLNIDLLGLSEVEAELELILFIMEVMKRLQAPKETYELKINSRFLLDYLFTEILKIEDKDRRSDITKAIDNYPKMDSEDFNDYLKSLDLNNSQIEQLQDFLKWGIQDLDEIGQKSKGAKELLNLFEKIKELEIENVAFCPYIVRGLDYYTGTVVEMFDVGGDKNPRALFGGGRYDNLLEIFEEKSIPAFGLGWGDVTTLDYLKTYNLLPKYSPDVKVFVALMKGSLFTQTTRIAQALREEGVKTKMQLIPEKLGKQLESANKESIPWVIILGEDEIKQNKVLLKNMGTSKQELLSLEEVFKRLKD